MFIISDSNVKYLDASTPDFLGSLVDYHSGKIEFSTLVSLIHLETSQRPTYHRQGEPVVNYAIDPDSVRQLHRLRWPNNRFRRMARPPSVFNSDTRECKILVLLSI